MHARSKKNKGRPLNAPEHAGAIPKGPESSSAAGHSAGNLADQHQSTARLSRTGLAIQRFPAPGAAGSSPAAPEVSGAPGAVPEEATAGAAAVPGLIVEDDVTSPATGQMNRGRFLSELRASVSTTADAALAGTLWSAVGCPWIEHWFNYYGGRSARHIERAIHRYVPEASGIAAARDYFPLINARVRGAIDQWKTTGEIGNLAQTLPGESPSGGSGGLLAGAARRASSLISGLGGLLFKKRPGGAGAAADPRGIQSQLRSGASLDGRVRAQAESRLGRDLSGVRVHTDGTAGRLAGQLNARAFTVGRDIVFGQGEYTPGTLIGDALIAHELAHVVQQGRSAPGPAEALEAGHPDGVLEREADQAAIETAAARHGLPYRAALPRLRTGLRLQRCETAREKEIKRLAGLQRSHLEQQAREQERQRREQQRQQEIARLRSRGVANPENQVPEVRAEEIQVTAEGVRDELNRTVQAATPPPNPIARWQNLPDQGAYLTAARSTLSRVESTARADAQFADIARLIRRKPLVITAETAKTGLRKGWYAWVDNSNFAVSMNFIDDASRDVRNVYPVIAHEIGGHTVDVNYLQEISQEMLTGLDPTLRASLVGTPELRQDYHMAYTYQATEIYSAVRQHRYERGIPGFTPHHGAISADANIPMRLTQLRDRWHPEVSKAVLQDLLRQLAANPEVRRDDINFLRSQITAIMGYSLPYPSAPRRSGGVDWSRKMCCFPGHLTVSTPGGPQPINQVTAGQSVLGRDPQTGKLASCEVLEVQVHRGTFPMLRIALDDSVIPVTPRHRFGVHAMGWCSSERLQRNDVLVTAPHGAVIREVAPAPPWSGAVYNLKVYGGCYFVGRAEVLVRDY